MYDKIEIYTGPHCNFCVLAKNLLNKNNLEFEEIKLEIQPNRRTEMLKRTNGKKLYPKYLLMINILEAIMNYIICF